MVRAVSAVGDVHALDLLLTQQALALGACHVEVLTTARLVTAHGGAGGGPAGAARQLTQTARLATAQTQSLVG